jgi:glycosyltransferase involved in cell wall biosynthesis
MSLRVLEACAKDSTYSWDTLSHQGAYQRVTLLEGGDVDDCASSEFGGAMWAALQAERPQVVLISGWSGIWALSPLKWCLANGVPCVMMSDSLKAAFWRPPWKEAIKRRVVRLCSAGLVAASRHAAYLEELGMARERIFLGYDAVDNEYFAQGAKEVRRREIEVRSKYGVPEKYFLASARFIEEKNLPRLLRAYARYRELALEDRRSKMEDGRQKTEGKKGNAETLKTEILKSEGKKAQIDHGPQTTGQQDPSDVPLSSSLVVPWSLVLLGDGPLRESLNSQLSTLNLHGHVHLPGFKQYPDLPAYYGLAEAFILPSISETWGLVVNEAMASGLPVLVSNRCGCAPDLVQEGANGFTFDPLDIEQLAQQMLGVWKMEDGRLERMGAVSARIIADWGPDRFANGLKQAVECALRVGPVKPTLLQRMILKAMLWR